MKVWKYIHFSDLTNKIVSGQTIKEPIVYAQTQPDSEYTDITTTELIYKHEYDLANERRIDGGSTYQEVHATMRVDRINASIDHATFKSQVYDPMYNTLELLNNGNWLDSYTELATVTVNSTLTEAMKTDLRLKLSTYLCDSGKYEEFNGSSYDSSGFII